ncbi:AraC family transcriptional regulator [Paenibacillus psychroresistens]|uniref:AraC family transcriptional regulator n=1 Tax=Paenibacillus psychroresistens TaxID=1778678 RepID=A0A6B8RRE3_9BACL|nr:AraC family transcriptional regulator [Paenibacillus psychroresistens]QGQ98427.1 AraC family transcriptional regulator [Paenibacillus psychroresistens]
MSTEVKLSTQWNDLYMLASKSSGKYQCEPSWSWQPSPFKDYDVWYVVSGRGKININQVSYSIQPGTCFILQPEDRISAEQNPNQPLFVLFCHFSMVDKEEKEAIVGILPEERCVTFRDTSLIEPLVHQLIELAHRQDDDNDSAEIDILLKLILTRWIRGINRKELPLQSYQHKLIILKIQDAIRFQLSEPINYEALVKPFGFTPRYISKLMKEHTGITLKETITKLRMERSVHLLTETTMSVTEVSNTLGYMDIYTFSKLFKRHYGYAPSKLR